MATEDKSSLSSDQKELNRPPDDQMEKISKQLRKRGYKIIVEYDDTGQPSKFSGEIPPRKTWWDWLQLLGILAIPLVVAGATLLFGIQQAKLADLQHQSDQKLAQQQHDADKQLTKDQQQQEALVAYEKDISDLLLIHHLGSPNEDVDSSEVADSRTLSTLQVLDPVRKGLLVYFLDETGLINAETGPIVHLLNADLRGSYLGGAVMREIYLGGADLKGSNLSGADLRGSNLSGADLRGTNLGCYRVNICADLRIADLSGADLGCYRVNICADLSGAYLQGANLSSARLEGTNLKGARYNIQEIQTKDILGNPLTLKLTQWPQGFDPKAAGAMCVDC